jgi:diguanylate cyclase (GGDEF)-like protein
VIEAAAAEYLRTEKIDLTTVANEVFSKQSVEEMGLKLPPWIDFNQSAQTFLQQTLLHTVQTNLIAAKVDLENRLTQDNDSLRKENIELKGDLADAKADKVMLEQQRDRDELTGLASLYRFNQRFEHVKEQIDRKLLANAVLIIFDMNKLKKVNDTYGHNTGDLVVKAFAECLKKAIRKVDMAGRLTKGDEFGMLLELADDEDPREVVQEVLKRLHDEMQLIRIKAPNGEMLRISTSIGVAVVDPKESIEQNKERADAEMYRHKNGLPLKDPRFSFNAASTDDVPSETGTFRLPNLAPIVGSSLDDTMVLRPIDPSQG